MAARTGRVFSATATLIEEYELAVFRTACHVCHDFSRSLPFVACSLALFLPVVFHDVRADESLRIAVVARHFAQIVDKHSHCSLVRGRDSSQTGQARQCQPRIGRQAREMYFISFGGLSPCLHRRLRMTKNFWQQCFSGSSPDFRPCSGGARCVIQKHGR